MKNLAFVFLVLFSFCLNAAQGFDKDRVVRAKKVLSQLVLDEKLAGGVLLVLRDGKPAFEHVFGFKDKEAGSVMARDTIFRIASQTKAIVTAAALILLEEGKLGLNDPVSKFIPSFAKTTVRSADGKSVPAKRPITLFDLMTHTSGISYGVQPEIAALYRDNHLSLANEKGEFTIPLVDANASHALKVLSKNRTIPG